MKHLWFKSRSKHSNQWKASLRDFVLNVKILDFSSSEIHSSSILLNLAQRKPLNRLSLGKLNVQVAFIQQHNISPFRLKKILFISLFMGMNSLQINDGDNLNGAIQNRMFRFISYEIIQLLYYHIFWLRQLWVNIILQIMQ